MKKSFSKAQNNKALLCACTLVSLCIHLLFLYVLHRHPLQHVSIATSQVPESEWEKVEKNAILKQAFDHHLEPSSQHAPSVIAQYEQEYRIEQIVEPTQPEQYALELSAYQKHSFDPRSFLTASTLSPIEFNTPSFDPDLLFPDLTIQTLAAPSSVTPPSTHKPQQEITPSLESGQIVSNWPKPIDQIPNMTFEGVKRKIPSLPADDSLQKKASLSIPTPPLPLFPSLDELETSSYSDFFDVELLCSPKGDDSGYLFALTLIPRTDLELPKMQQHYSFLIDRANSIQRERLLATKSAVLRAIQELSSEDTFNVIVFDSKVEKAFATHQHPTPDKVIEARRFLDQIQLGSFFAPADLYNPLFLTLPAQIKEEELHTTLLLTDGENFSKKSTLHSILGTWTEQNRGRVSLYTIAMGSDIHLPALDVASAFNKGNLSYSPSKRGIKRKLMKQMKNIRCPIAKDLHAKAISLSPKTSVELYPKNHQIPHLYRNQPIVLIGSTNRQEDFVLFVQGRCKDRWFNIKKNISFLSAKKGGVVLRKEWALQKSYACYEAYVQDDQPEHLVEARDFLEPFDILPAFQ